MTKLPEPLQPGPGRLRFASALESDYQSEALPSRRQDIRWSQALMLVVIFAMLSHTHAGGSLDVLLAATPAMSLSIALFAFSLVNAGRGTLDLLGIGLFGSLLAIACDAVASGVPGGLSVYIALVVAGFWLMGLEFKLATACAVICIPTAAVASSVAGHPPATTTVSGILLAALAFTLALSAYRSERVNRQSFLKSRELNFRATRDIETGLANRQALDEFLERAWRHCSRDGVPIAVASIRIDHYPEYLHHYGRDKANDCIQSMARVVESACRRPLDFVARLEVDEFIIVLPGCNTQRGVDVADSLRRDVIASVREHAGSPTSALLTVSVGVASSAARSQTSETLMRDAQKALTAAQHAGYNRVATVDKPGQTAGFANVIRLSDVRHAASRKAR